VVVAWLWRKFAASTRLTSNEIVLNPCCAINTRDLEDSEASPSSPLQS